jgi:hypothetical protein
MTVRPCLHCRFTTRVCLYLVFELKQRTPQFGNDRQVAGEQNPHSRGRARVSTSSVHTMLLSLAPFKRQRYKSTILGQ